MVFDIFKLYRLYLMSFIAIVRRAVVKIEWLYHYCLIIYNGIKNLFFSDIHNLIYNPCGTITYCLGMILFLIFSIFVSFGVCIKTRIL